MKTTTRRPKFIARSLVNTVIRHHAISASCDGISALHYNQRNTKRSKYGTREAAHRKIAIAMFYIIYAQCPLVRRSTRRLALAYTDAQVLIALNPFAMCIRVSTAYKVDLF